MEPTRLSEGGAFVPNKALGQNFLTDEAVTEAILDAAKIDRMPVCEIGPGRGALTRGLCARAKRVVAVEKDARLVAYLGETLPAEKLTLVHADVLDADISALMGTNDYAAVGNLPYCATTPIVQRFLGLQPVSMTFMVQAEAAERFFAPPRARIYGPTAVVCAVYYDAERVLNVPRTAFSPQPDVESAVVRLTLRADAPRDAAAFLAFLKHVFAMRRKTLKNHFTDVPDFAARCDEAGCAPGDRAEALAPETLYRLMQSLKKERY